MTNQENIEMYRKELRTLSEIQFLELGPMARKAVHERMLLVAFRLQESDVSSPAYLEQLT